MLPRNKAFGRNCRGGIWSARQFGEGNVWDKERRWTDKRPEKPTGPHSLTVSHFPFDPMKRRVRKSSERRKRWDLQIVVDVRHVGAEAECLSIGHFRFRRPALVVQHIPQVSPRLGRIDVNPCPVELLLIHPVLVPPNRSNGQC